jgi:hypothetical protein
MKNRKFVTLYETIYNRYKQGSGFLEGDVVKLKSDYKSTEGYKSLTDSVKQRLEDASKSGYNIRVGRLHTPNANAGALGINVNLPATHADIYEEKTPGNFGNLMTIPVDVLEVHDTGVNLPPVSKNNKREASEAPYQKPGKWKANKDTAETKDQNHVGHEQNWVKNGDYELATKNKKSSVGANKYNDDKPSKFKDLPIRESAVMEGLLGAYQKVLTEEVEVDDEINDTGATAKALDHDDDITSEEKENMAVAAGDLTEDDMKIEEHMVKPECWNKERNTVIDECWNEDGSMKEECWQGEAMAEDTDAGLAQGGNVVAPEEKEQTSALEELTGIPDVERSRKTGRLEFKPVGKTHRK